MRFRDKPLFVLKHLIRALAYGLVGGFLVLIVVFVYYLESQPDLHVWHEEILDEEFQAGSSIQDLEAYRVLENRLFAQLDTQVYDQISPEQRQAINRYHRGSYSDPGRWPTNWNRTYELAAEAPELGVLLLHGMSDSPYSLRGLGQRLNGAGAQVLGLRLPGHGTAPSGLVEVHWQDMAAAINLALRHLRDKLGDRPIYIVGYSNGGALAVHHALESLNDSSLIQPNGLILISPAIGVTKLAALAVWQARLGHLLGLDKLAWNDVLPEYDPYKYGSFAVNAGDQSYRLSLAIQAQLNALQADQLQRMPPVLAFQSIVDATVSVPAVVHGLFERLPEAGHELVLFDINQAYEMENLLKESPRAKISGIFGESIEPYTLTHITNEHEGGNGVMAIIKPAGSSEKQIQPVGIDWPRGLYSLSHVAMPISENDPLYGGPNADKSPGIELGKLALRGERGVLQIGAAAMLRLRWNPFYPYLEQRVLEFVGLNSQSEVSGRSKIPVKDQTTLGHDALSSEAIKPCKAPRPEVCTQQYDPVCARHSDGAYRTYANGCMACTHQEVLEYRAGACQ
jgi:alpha-beta hydrolase superfamily lysophospholipase